MKKLILTLLISIFFGSLSYAGNVFEDLMNVATLGEYHNQIKQMRAKMASQLAEKRAELARVKKGLKKQLVQVRVDVYQELVNEAAANHEKLALAKADHEAIVQSFDKLIIAQNRASEYWELTEQSASKIILVLEIMSQHYNDDRGIQLTNEFTKALGGLVELLNTDVESNPEIIIALQQVSPSLLRNLYTDIQRLDISVFAEMIFISEQVVERLESKLNSHQSILAKIGS